MKTFRKFAVMGILALLMLPAAGWAQAPVWRHASPDAAAAAAPRTIAPYFTPATSQPKAPDADGFLQRWMLLEPIVKAKPHQHGFYRNLRAEALNTEYFPDQFTVLPHNGQKVTVAGQELAWHALDSTGFNVKLFRFAYGLNKPTYGVFFWAVTVVNSPREMKDVRLAVGSNSASMWWLNGEDVAGLFDDRRMVMDDVVSKRLTLKKGQNVLRGAVINGPGLSDFCVRFVDENGNPLKDLTLSLAVSTSYSVYRINRFVFGAAMKSNPLAAAILALLALCACGPALAQLAGEPYIHDPSTVIQSDGKYFTFGTGGGGLISDDGYTWHSGAVRPGGGVAPDVIKLGDRYYVAYAVGGGGMSGGHASNVKVMWNKTLDPKSPNFRVS